MPPRKLQASPADIDHFWERGIANAETGCLEWSASLTFDGYGAVCWLGKVERANRVAFILSHGPIPAGLVIRHRCHNRKCIHPGHLSSGTRADNMADMVARGKARKPHFRLSRQDRADIVLLADARRHGLCQWATQSFLAELFDVDTSTIKTTLRNGPKFDNGVQQEGA